MKQVKGLPSASYEDAIGKLQGRNVYYIDKRAAADDQVGSVLRGCGVVALPFTTLCLGAVPADGRVFLGGY
jgi:hypothetical protein